jgi:hypothetical protein
VQLDDIQDMISTSLVLQRWRSNIATADMQDFMCFNTFSGTVGLDWSHEWQVGRAMETAVDLVAMANLGKQLAQIVVHLLS